MSAHLCSQPSSISDKQNLRLARIGTKILLSSAVLLLFLHVSGSTGFAQTRMTPSALSFGSQVINQPSAVMSATIENTQSVPLSIGGIAISGGSAAGDYVAGGNCPLSPGALGPGAECRITVTFTPSALGARTATLTVTDDAHARVATISLTGTGAAPADGIPANGNFAGSSATSLATVSNAPSATGASSDDVASDKLQRGRPVNPIGVIGSNSPILSPAGTASLLTGLISIVVTPAYPSISSGSTQQFAATGYYKGATTKNLTPYVLWSSSATGVATINSAGLASGVSSGSTTITASLVVETEGGTTTGTAPGTPIVNKPSSIISGSTLLSVTGGITAPQAGLSPNLTFTSQNVGTTSGVQDVTLTNSGNATLSISSVALGGSNPGDFGVSNGCGSTLAASGGNCTLYVTFSPTTSGTRSASLTVTDNSGNITGSQQSVTLTGTGSAPEVSLNASALSFNSQVQGTTSSSQTVTLTNIGNATLSLNSFSVTGNNPGDFPESSTCGSSLTMGNYCTFTISFDPTNTGYRSASLVITDNNNNVTGSQQTVTLSGTGLAPLAISTTGFVDAVVGQPYSAYLIASGGAGGYTWGYTVGSGQSFPSCLVVSTNAGFLVGTPVSTCLGSYTFNLVVTDSASNQVSQTVNINIDPPTNGPCESGNESILQGQYAFSLIGYKGSTTFLARVGSFTANGTGSITGGEYDRNSTGGSPATYTFTGGTYTVGADNRGCATFNVSNGSSFSTRFVLGSISSGTATQGRIMEFDTPNSSAFIAMGQLLQQTSSTSATASNFSALSGGYVHLLTGWDTSSSGGRIACDGVKTDTPTSGGAGTIASGEQYCNDEGNAPSGPNTGITGSYTAVDNYGRFTEVVGTTDLAGYLVSTGATGTLEITTSVNGSNKQIMAGQTYQQSGGPYGQGSITGAGVYYANGLGSSTTGDIQFALASSDGISTLSINADYENDGGTWVQNGTTMSCTYSVAANGGLSGCGGMMYLTAPTTAVVVNNDGGVSAGYVLPQTVPGSGFSAANLTGAFAGGTTEIVNQNAESHDAIVTFQPGSGSALTGSNISDDTSTSGQQADEVEAISGITLASSGTLSSSKHGTPQVSGLAVDTGHILITNSTGCSGSSSCYPTIELYGPTNADTVAITVNGSASSSNNLTAGTSLPLTVLVTGTTNTNVAWTINGLSNSTTDYGSITGSYPSFAYTAPTRVPDVATFTLTATSKADVSQSASVTVTIQTAASGASPLTITTTSLPSGTLNTSYNQNILTNGGTLPLTWVITSGSPPPGISVQYGGNGLGQVTGVHTTTTGTYTFVVFATDSSTPTAQTAYQQLSIVMNPSPVTITTTSLPNGTATVPYNQTINANGGTRPYTWSVISGALPGWATLNPSTGAITGTPTTGTSSFTVQVTDSTLPTHVTASQSLSITINSNLALPCTDSGSESLLNGQYAFNLTGYTSSGYLSVVGSFNANGSGGFTAGEADTNGVLGVQNSVIDTTHSSYSVGSNNLGCATIVTSFGTFNTRLALNSAVAATQGRMVEWDAPSSSTYFAATGQFLLQNTSSFSGGLSGTYVFGESGVDGNNSAMAMAGLISTGANSTLTGGEFDMNDAGAVMNLTGGTGSYGSADSNGRIALSTTWPGSSSSNPTAMYMVSTSQLLFLTSSLASTSGVMTGQMIQQTAPGGYGASSFSGNMVFYQTEENSGSSGEVQIGLLSSDGASYVTVASYDDAAGTWQTYPGMCTATLSVASNGRLALPSTCGDHPPIFYLTNANTGFMLGVDQGVGYGQILPQTYSGTTNTGTFFMGDLDVANFGVAGAEQIGVGIINVGNGGTFSMYNDYTATTGQSADVYQTGTFPTINTNGTFSVYTGVPVSAIAISPTMIIMVDDADHTYPILEIIQQ
jgi:hypothetical protein